MIHSRGEGAFGKVKLANHNLSGEKVAVKIFEKFVSKPAHTKRQPVAAAAAACD